MKSKLFESIKNILAFVFNPKLLLCFGIAWIITNGWSYIFAFLGPLLGFEWMTAVGVAYMGFLWLPFTPEKLVTLAIAIFLLKLLFPNDKKTLFVLSEQYKALKEISAETLKRIKARRNNKK